MGWDDLARESADALASRRDADGLWTQTLWGTSFRGIGTVHGLAGNVRALLRVDDPRNEALRTESAAALSRAAKREDGLANWGSEGKLQWDGSGPGIVSAARDYLDEELLLAGAELVWRAGPPGAEKGHAICHGTSGNGFALLAAFERTQDELWLDRARRFAVHALAQAALLPGATRSSPAVPAPRSSSPPVSKPTRATRCSSLTGERTSSKADHVGSRAMDERLERYAELAVRVGANVQPGRRSSSMGSSSTRSSSAR